MHKFLYLFVLLLLTCFCSCASDEIKEENLIGNWSLVSGTLNDEPAGQFEGFTMQFTSENKLRSTIITEMSNGLHEVDYKLLTAENKIQLANLPIVFDVHKLQEDTLQLSFDMLRDGEVFKLNMLFKREK